MFQLSMTVENQITMQHFVKITRFLMQFFGSARTMWSPSQKRYQNGPMICVWLHALHVPVHSSHLEFIAETNVCAYTKIICIWKFLTRICEIFKTVKPEEASFVFSTKSTQSLRPILSCYLCFPPAFLHFYFLPLLGKFERHYLIIPGIHHFLLDNLCLAERNGFGFRPRFQWSPPISSLVHAAHYFLPVASAAQPCHFPSGYKGSLTQESQRID